MAVTKLVYSDIKHCILFLFESILYAIVNQYILMNGAV